MKRSRSSYLIYFPDGAYTEVFSKFQGKKILWFAPKGTEMFKRRLIHSRDGTISFWNFDTEYDSWVVEE